MSDEDDFEALYESTRLRLVAQLIAFTNDRNDACDIVQEAFVRAWLHWSQVSSYADPESWVRHVAYRLAIGRWRKMRRIQLRSDLAMASSLGASDTQLDVVRALKDLPLLQRRAIVLHYLADLSVEEVSVEMGAPIGTVKSWLSRGRAELAIKLSPNSRETAT